MDISNLGIELLETQALYRIRLDSWRVVYVLEEDLQLLTVPCAERSRSMAIRKRPPYQYEDLRDLFDKSVPS